MSVKKSPHGPKWLIQCIETCSCTSPPTVRRDVSSPLRGYMSSQHFVRLSSQGCVCVCGGGGGGGGGGEGLPYETDGDACIFSCQVEVLLNLWLMETSRCLSNLLTIQ